MTGPDVWGQITANSSLIHAQGGMTIVNLATGNDILGQPALLGPLGNYGGPTETIPLRPAARPSTPAPIASFPRA